jgi:hypothetical protein
LPAQGRLCDTKFLRRFGEVQLFTYGDKVAEMAEFHGRTIPEKHRGASIKVLGGIRGPG